MVTKDKKTVQCAAQIACRDLGTTPEDLKNGGARSCT